MNLHKELCLGRSKYIARKICGVKQFAVDVLWESYFCTFCPNVSESPALWKAACVNCTVGRWVGFDLCGYWPLAPLFSIWSSNTSSISRIHSSNCTRIRSTELRVLFSTQIWEEFHIALLCDSKSRGVWSGESGVATVLDDFKLLGIQRKITKKQRTRPSDDGSGVCVSQTPR